MNKVSIIDTKPKKYKKKTCSKCGRNNHNSNECYATMHISGMPCEVYEEMKEMEEICNPKKDKCTRCGRNTHVIQNCFANTHINGKQF
jgi:ribosomal protein S14